MNTKKLFAGTIAALVLSTGLVTEVSAKPSFNGQPSPQMMAGRGHAALNLTPEQEEQMKQIHSSTRARIESVLTPAQKEQLNAARGEGRVEGRGEGRGPGRGEGRGEGRGPGRGEGRVEGRGEGRGPGRGGHNIWEQLNLTAQQLQQIDRIRQESKDMMDAVLTPQQREQLQQMHENRHQNRRQS